MSRPEHLKGYKLCPECGQPTLKKGQQRKHPGDYRHAYGCPNADFGHSPAIQLMNMTAKLQEIIRVVGEYYNTRPEDMKAERRDARVVLPRHVAIFLAREITGYSFARIARALNRSDHTTAMFAIKRIEDRLARDPELLDDINAIRWQLGAHKLPEPAARLNGGVSVTDRPDRLRTGLNDGPMLPTQREIDARIAQRAAGPDLYRALKRLLIECREGGKGGHDVDLLPRETIEEAELAIRKAEALL